MTIDEAYEGYFAAVRSGNRRDAFDVVQRARDAGLELEALHLSVFQPALREIGRLWQENLLTVAEEHLATAITQTAMLRVYGELDMPARSGPMLIAACAETERHEIGLRMLCDFLDLQGWDTVFLGPSVPSESLVSMVKERQPHAVALSVSITPHLPQVRRTIAAIREVAGGRQPLVVVGGRPLMEQPELAQEMGADFTAHDAAEAAALICERVS